MKEWLLEILVKKGGPSAIRGAILGVFGWLLAKQGALTSFGVLTDPATHSITINLDKLNIALVALLPALMAAVIKLVNHHADQIISPVKIDPTSTPTQTS